MPELRSGARQGRLKSKKLEDIPALPQPQAENPVLPAPNRRRGGAARGRGAKAAAAVAKGPPAAPVRLTVGGRGKGIKLIDLDPDLPCQVLPGAAAVGGAQDIILKQAVEGVAGKDLAMDGRSAEKAVGAEDEATTAPVPERVCLFAILSN